MDFVLARDGRTSIIVSICPSHHQEEGRSATEKEAKEKRKIIPASLVEARNLWLPLIRKMVYAEQESRPDRLSYWRYAIFGVVSSMKCAIEDAMTHLRKGA